MAKNKECSVKKPPNSRQVYCEQRLLSSEKIQEKNNAAVRNFGPRNGFLLFLHLYENQ
jgi:hypothetical protein